MRRTTAILLLLIIQLHVGCANTEKKEFTEAERLAEAAQLRNFFDREFQVELQKSPMLQTRLGIKTNYGQWDNFSHLQYAKDLELAKKRLDFLEDSIEIEALEANSLLSYRLYRQKVENEIADYDFRFYDYPINQMNGVHTQLPAFLINMHQVGNVRDAEAYISRLKGIPKVLEDVVEGLKLREINLIVPPSFVFDLTLEASRNIISGRPFEKSTESSALLGDFHKKVEALELPSAEEQVLMRQAEEALVEKVGPAYKKLIATLEDQQQRATNDHGVWKFPKGDEYYARTLERYTTTDLSAQDIHEFGLDEVARIHKKMEEIKEEVGFDGSLKDFFVFMRTDEQFYYPNDSIGRQAYLEKATAIIETMKGRLDELFITLPQADLEVKAVEAFREKSAGIAFYSAPALDGSRPGYYYANLYDMQAMPKYQMEALAYHEGIPGHHMQLAIAQELEGVPEFRKISYYGAYIEGWGLYGELVPKELGFYEDPYSDFGRLAAELWRAIRLVVDTGIHAKKWTRERAIEYYMTNSSNSEGDVIKMVERHIVIPGQATSYKIGLNTILELRQRSKEALGKNFDLRKFHEVVLTKGAMPLNILEDNVDKWIETQKHGGGNEQTSQEE